MFNHGVHGDELNGQDQRDLHDRVQVFCYGMKSAENISGNDVFFWNAVRPVLPVFPVVKD
jgi:hypothetical protein